MPTFRNLIELIFLKVKVMEFEEFRRYLTSINKHKISHQINENINKKIATLN
jgi:hypothetical protein